jgi:hypothetical protein
MLGEVNQISQSGLGNHCPIPELRERNSRAKLARETSLTLRRKQSSTASIQSGGLPPDTVILVLALSQGRPRQERNESPGPNRAGRESARSPTFLEADATLDPLRAGVAQGRAQLARENRSDPQHRATSESAISAIIDPRRMVHFNEECNSVAAGEAMTNGPSQRNDDDGRWIGCLKGRRARAAIKLRSRGVCGNRVALYDAAVTYSPSRQRFLDTPATRSSVEGPL